MLLAGHYGSLPVWLQPHWPRFCLVLEQLSTRYSRSAETKLKNLIERFVPWGSEDMLYLNYQADSLHMKFLRQALTFEDVDWYKRAVQHGDHHASFPLLFDWDKLSSELRKYVVFVFIRFYRARSGHTLRLLPCSLLRCVDFVEWLPSAGLNSGWESIRHYLGQLQAFSMVCGFGNIRELDEPGFKIWKDNFKANIQVSRAPRGGDIPLQPWMLRSLAKVFAANTPYDLFMKANIALMWFTALRPGHFSPESLLPEHMKHLLEWQFLDKYMAKGLGSSRPTLHLEIPSSKNNQSTRATPWSTATACICASYDCSPEEYEDLTALCPVCALERYRSCVPSFPGTEFSNLVFLDPASGKPMLRNKFTRCLREAINLGLSHLPLETREYVVRQLAPKSWRSGAGTALVTAGNAGFIAAAFLHHESPDITQKYYHKGGAAERLQCLPDLANPLITD